MKKDRVSEIILMKEGTYLKWEKIGLIPESLDCLIIWDKKNFIEWNDSTKIKLAEQFEDMATFLITLPNSEWEKKYHPIDDDSIATVMFPIIFRLYIVGCHFNVIDLYHHFVSFYNSNNTKDVENIAKEFCKHYHNKIDRKNKLIKINKVNE